MGETRKQQYARLKLAGICPYCGHRPAVVGKVACETCAEVRKDFYNQIKSSPKYREDRYEKLKDWVEKNRPYSRKRNRSYIKRRRDEVFRHYGGKCACCGIFEFVFLSLDHLYNDGKKDREKFGTGTTFYRRVKDAGYPSTLQLLCHNCNQAFRILGYCPHNPDSPRRHVWYKERCSNCDSERTNKTSKEPCSAPKEFPRLRHDSRCGCDSCRKT